MEPSSPVAVRDSMLRNEKLLVVGKTYCPYTQRAKAALHELGLQPSILDVDVTPNGGALQQAFSEVSGIKTVPQVFVGGECVGGCDATLAAIRDGLFQKKCAAAGVPMAA